MIILWTVDKTDEMFSKYIRERDKRCMHPRCQRPWDTDIRQMQNSHYFGRGEWATRFDPDNCDTAHRGCHLFQWENTKNTDYLYFKKAQLGMKRFNKMKKKVEESKKIGYYVSHGDRILECMNLLRKVGFVDENYKLIK